MHARGFKVHGVMVEQELLHLIHLQKMNCLISFTREIEVDINQERDNFQGLFYYLDMKQSNSIGRSEERIPCVVLPCTQRFMLGSELPAGLQQTRRSPLGASGQLSLKSCHLALPKLEVAHGRTAARQLSAFLGKMFRKKGDRVSPVPSFLSSWQIRKCLDVHELLVFLNCFLKDCCCDSQE